MSKILLLEGRVVSGFFDVTRKQKLFEIIGFLLEFSPSSRDRRRVHKWV